MAVRAVMFDVDGTLVDSNDAHAHAWVDGFAACGYDVPFEQVRPLIGMGGDKLMPEVAGIETDSDDGKRVDEQRAKALNEHYLATLKPFPQVRALVEHIKRSGLQVGVASSSKADELEKLLKIAQVDDLIEHETSSSDASQSKPDPDIVQAALDKLGSAPDETVLIGDTPYDIEAAHKAGVKVIALRSGGWRDFDADVPVYDDPADLLAHFDRSLLNADA